MGGRRGLTRVDGEGGGSDDGVPHAVLRHALVLGVVLARLGGLDPEDGHGWLGDDHVARGLRRHLKKQKQRKIIFRNLFPFFHSLHPLLIHF